MIGNGLRAGLACAGLLAGAMGDGFAHGALEAQIDKLTAEIARAPADAQLYLRRGELHRLHEEWDAALADYARAAAQAPADDRVDFLRGRALQQAGRSAQAKQALDAYVARHPGHVEARVARARALRALHDDRAAAADYRYAIERSPKPDPDLYLERARAELAAGDIAQAGEGLEAARLRLGPIASIELLAVDVEVRQGRFDAALARLDAMAARSPRKEAWLARRGDVLAEAGRRDEARTAYAAALAAIAALPPDLRSAKAIGDLEARVRRALAT